MLERWAGADSYTLRAVDEIRRRRAADLSDSDRETRMIELAEARVCTLWRSALDGPARADASDSAEMADLVRRTRNVIGALRLAEESRIKAVAARSQLEATIARTRLSDEDRKALRKAVSHVEWARRGFSADRSRHMTLGNGAMADHYTEEMAKCDQAVAVLDRLIGVERG